MIFDNVGWIERHIGKVLTEDERQCVATICRGIDSAYNVDTDSIEEAIEQFTGRQS